MGEGQQPHRPGPADLLRLTGLRQRRRARLRASGRHGRQPRRRQRGRALLVAFQPPDALQRPDPRGQGTGPHPLRGRLPQRAGHRHRAQLHRPDDRLGQPHRRLPRRHRREGHLHPGTPHVQLHRQHAGADRVAVHRLAPAPPVHRADLRLVQPLAQRPRGPGIHPRRQGGLPRRGKPEHRPHRRHSPVPHLHRARPRPGKSASRWNTTRRI